MIGDRHTEFRQKLGQRVRAAREAAGFTQMDVLQQAGVSLSHYQKIERGVLDPRFSTMIKLASFFGASLDSLAGRFE